MTPLWLIGLGFLSFGLSSCNEDKNDENLMMGISIRKEEVKSKGLEIEYTGTRYTYFDDVENGEQKYCFYAQFRQYVSESEIYNGKDLFMYVVGETETRELSFELYESITYYVQHGEYKGKLGYVDL